MLLQAALNGARAKTAHAALPASVDELSRDAVACVAAGARAIHLHPRDDSGQESLDAAVVDAVVRQVQAAGGVPVGVTTGAWIEPDLQPRLDLIRAWRAPNYSSVNLSEECALDVMRLLIEIGVGIEAGVSTVEDAALLGKSGLGVQVTRILIEPGEEEVGSSVDDALKLADAIHRELDRFGLTVPRLQHGNGAVTWALLADAVRRGIDTRVGLEDTLYEPSAQPTSGNAALVRAARGLGAGDR